MGRSRKRRHQEVFASRSTEREDFGVGAVMQQMKKPRLSQGASAAAEESSQTTSDPVSNGHQEIPNASTDATEGDWHTVEYKSSRQSRKRDVDGTKTKYPELVFHLKPQHLLRIADLQQLVLYTLADGVAPNWVAFKHSGHTRKVVALMVPGLERGMFDGSSDLSEAAKEAVGSDGHSEEARDGEHSIPEAKPAQDTDAEKRNRDQFEYWKNGNQSKEPPTSYTAPIELKGSKLPPILLSITDAFHQVWSVRAPGDSKYGKLHSPLQAMLIAPLPTPKENKGIKGPKPPAEEKSFKPARTPISQFVHSVDELREAEYPIHPAAFVSLCDAQLEKNRREHASQSINSGWLDTAVTSQEPKRPSSNREQNSITEGLEIYAIDCEMVLTDDDVYSLARISVLNWSGQTVLDKYVKPSLPIKNYYTQFSGITPALLENVTTTLADIQSELLRLFTPSSIILGHSLESDLNAMKLTHPFIIDTSLIYPHPRGPPLRSSLKFLTQKYLRREIQVGGENGHNSIEDALAVLDLVKLKCEKGPRWGTSEASGEPIFRRLARSSKERTSAIVDYGTPERGYGKEATYAIGCSNDDEVVQGLLRAVNGDSDGKEIKAGGVDFVWGRLRELESFRGWCNNNREYSNVDGLHTAGNGTTVELKNPSPDMAIEAKPADEALSATSPLTSSPSAPSQAATLTSTLSSTISHIHTIYEALPPCTLFLVYSGTGDPRDVGRLQKMQTQYRKEFKVKKWDELSVKWTDVEEQALRRAVEKARDGVGFMTVK